MSGKKKPATSFIGIVTEHKKEEKKNKDKLLLLGKEIIRAYIVKKGNLRTSRRSCRKCAVTSEVLYQCLGEKRKNKK